MGFIGWKHNVTPGTRNGDQSPKTLWSSPQSLGLLFDLNLSANWEITEALQITRISLLKFFPFLACLLLFAGCTGKKVPDWLVWIFSDEGNLKIYFREFAGEGT